MAERLLCQHLMRDQSAAQQAVHDFVEAPSGRLNGNANSTGLPD